MLHEERADLAVPIRPRGSIGVWYRLYGTLGCIEFVELGKDG